MHANRAELKDALVENSIREDAYVLDDRVAAYEALGLRIVEGGWEVYYLERGSKNRFGMFETEDEACRFLLTLALKDPTMRIAD